LQRERFMSVQKIAIFILKIIVVGILLLVMRLKFSGDPESVYIFTSIKMEPWGRIGVGILEGIACILILYRRTTGWGALLTLILMTGAIFFHLTTFDVTIAADKESLFYLSIIVWICSAILFMKFRAQVLIHLRKITGG